MKQRLLLFLKAIIFSATCFFLFSFLGTSAPQPPALKFPYKQAGLTDRQAAAHLLNRFTFGPTYGQIDDVLKIGMEKWFLQQLNGGISDDSLKARLTDYDAIAYTNTQANAVFPRPVQILRMAREEGVIPKDSVKDKKMYKKEIARYMKQNNYRRQGEYFRQFINYKILRAAYSNNQMQEVLADFWFNHFNVSLTKKDCSLFIPAYERDAIRPNVTAKFQDLLLATAKSSAMLLYLDNFTSVGQNDMEEDDNEKKNRRLERLRAMNDTASQTRLQKLQKRKKSEGLNEIMHGKLWNFIRWV